MEVQTKRNGDFTEYDRIVIKIGESEFRISVNQFNQLVINKYHDRDHTMIIKPSTGNEIRVE